MEDADGSLQAFDFEQSLDARQGYAAQAQAPSAPYDAGQYQRAIPPEASGVGPARQGGGYAPHAGQAGMPGQGQGVQPMGAQGYGWQGQQGMGRGGFHQQGSMGAAVRPYGGGPGGYGGHQGLSQEDLRRINYQKTVCRHWLRNMCLKGAECSYLHQYDKSRMPWCRTFQNYGVCEDKDCPFKHYQQENRKECHMYVPHWRTANRCRLD